MQTLIFTIIQYKMSSIISILAVRKFTILVQYSNINGTTSRIYWEIKYIETKHQIARDGMIKHHF
ncbi:MAG: hypothetical protein COA73_00925 [Candidatus Hydrogenedentota bacterium]|nr:MAG: hypothetical protein COA73_00925 [Candidatus Hydrogenedentota bacterium]